MIVTIPWLESNFGRFNSLYFDAKLPAPLFGLSRSRTRLGTMAYKRTSRFGKGKLYDFTIRLTTYYDMTEWQAQNILLHEMIHYIIAYTGLKDTSSHGTVFRGMADALNRRYGWKISVRTDARGWQVNSKYIEEKKEAKPQTYLILAIRMNDDKCYVSRVNPSYFKRIDSQLRRVTEVQCYGWFTTCDDTYETFSQVRSLRGRRVSRQDYDNIVGSLLPFVPSGK